jgi:hypothetical protein
MRKLLLLLVTAAACLTASAADASAQPADTPNPFTTSASRTAVIHFVPLDHRARQLLTQAVPVVKRWISPRYTTEITDVPTSKAGWLNPKRDQIKNSVVIDDLLTRFKRARGNQSALLVPVTTRSMYDPKIPQLNFEFGAITGASRQAAAIVATGNMRVIHAEREKDRLTKILLRYIGLGVCHFKRSSDPKSVMYSPLISCLQIDRMVAALPRRC